MEDDDCEREAGEASEIMEKVTYGLVSIEDALKEIERNGSNASSGGSGSKQKSQSLVRSESRESLNSVVSENENYSRKVKLLKLELKKFSGKIAEWAEFWDGFKSAVHDDPDLAKIDKFKYLRCYLEEPAKSVYPELANRRVEFRHTVFHVILKINSYFTTALFYLNFPGISLLQILARHGLLKIWTTSFQVL